MGRQLIAAFAVVLVGCGTPSGVDSGTGGGGGATGGGSATGGGGGGAATGGGGGSTWDGGSSGTLVGADAFPIGWVTTGFQSADGGFASAQRFLAIYFDKPSAGTCTSPNTPFSMVEVRVELADAGVVRPGTYALDSTSYITRVDYTALGMATDVGGFGTTGSITISRFDARSSAGTFTTTLSLLDGGTAPLSGTWDTGSCQ